jgi:hypothetical protein
VKVALVVILAVGCGGKRDSEPPPPPALACAPGELVAAKRCTRTLTAEQVDMVGQQASRLADAGKLLSDPAVLDQARDVLAALHELAAWKRAAAKDAAFQAVDPAAIHTAGERARGLGGKLGEAAKNLEGLCGELAAIAIHPEARTVDAVRALVSTRIADAIGPLGVEVTAAIRDSLGTLPTRLVDEIVLARDRVCTAQAREPVCARLPVVQAAYEYTARAGQAARQGLDEAGGLLEQHLGDLLDAHARTAIDRATGRGPSYGEPCGPEGLCAWNQRCEQATHTCEHPCSEVAMSPCPDNLACRKVDGLDGTFCRR